MPRNPPARLPITPGTVTVDGVPIGPINLMWNYLRWHEAKTLAGAFLIVPRCHPDDDMDSHNCPWSHVRPRDKYADYRFARQHNGNWMLVREDTQCLTA